MITRKVDNDDALAGFTYNWVKNLGSNLDKLYVITWQKSNSVGLLENIEVISLPEGKFNKVLFLQKKLLQILPKVDGVFCHMNPEYTILSAPLAKIFRKKIVSWYTHKSITWRRRLLEILANKIVTASIMSFRKPWFSKKVNIIGHGIDVDLFKPLSNRQQSNNFNIISVGRISPTKDYESIIKAVDILNNKDIRLKIIGDVILEYQRDYLSNLKKMTSAMSLENQVEFIGWVSNKSMPYYYQNADLFINMSGTGSVDKVVLEAMSSGCLVLTSNEAFREIIGDKFMIEKDNPNSLADKIQWINNLPIETKELYANKLRDIVVTDHNLKNLVKKIKNQF